MSVRMKGIEPVTEQPSDRQLRVCDTRPLATDACAMMDFLGIGVRIHQYVFGARRDDPVEIDLISVDEQLVGVLIPAGFDRRELDQHLVDPAQHVGHQIEIEDDLAVGLHLID